MRRIVLPCWNRLCGSTYHLYPAYKKEANKIINNLPKRLENKITDWLLEIGYNKKVVKDEIQAYLSAEDLPDDINTTPTENKKINKIRNELKNLVEKYKKRIRKY